MWAGSDINPPSFHFARRRVSLFRDDLILDGLTLFVGDAERFVGSGVHELHFDLAELAIARLIGRFVTDDVLIPQRLVDGTEDTREFSVEAWEKRHSTRLFRERSQLVVGL